MKYKSYGIEYVATVLLGLMSLSVFCLHDNEIMKTYEYFTELFDKMPAKAELEVYRALKVLPIEKNINYLAIPWTSLIKENKQHQVPDIRLDGGFTICLHAQYKKIIPILKRIGIDTLFTPHVEKGRVYEGINVLPFAFDAVNGIPPAKKKDLLYSFVGYNTHPIRMKIFKMSRPKNSIIKQRNKWHFHIAKAKEKEEYKKEYQDLLSRSRFSICPRGAAPSTIRFWESLQAGAIPVLISDAMVLPDGVNWDECIVRIAERDVSSINTVIASIPPEKEQKMRENCLRAYTLFSGENIVSNIRLHYAHWDA